MRIAFFSVACLLPTISLADCGAARQSYMALQSIGAANDLITCLESDNVSARIGNSEGDQCPNIPIIPIGGPYPTNPNGMDEVFAFMAYY